MKTNQLTLTRDSSVLSIKAYFEAINELYDKHGMAFCVDFDTVWQLAYARKDNATKSLIGVSTEGIDYQQIRQKAEKHSDGRGIKPVDKYMLTVPTLEWFIARRVPAVFEVYRQVFHQVRKQSAQLPIVPTELAERVGSPMLIGGKLYWPYRRVLQTLGYKRPGSKFYKRAALANVQLDLFNPNAQDDYKVAYGTWYCSADVFERVRRARVAWDRYISERDYVALNPNF